MTVTDKKFNLNSVYKELKHELDIWGEGGSGWTIDKIENIWIKISNYGSLAGSSYIPLPSKLNNSMKGLVNIENKDIECFKWCHIGLVNPQNTNPERIKKQDKKISSTLDYRGINFPMKGRDCEVVKNFFCYMFQEN